jgi:defect-in-organelle-trafficking protein DotC
MSKRLALHVTAGIASLLIQAAPSWAENGVAIYPVPPVPPPAVVDEAARELGNPLNKPITGAAQVPAVAGAERPPSLETLQAEFKSTPNESSSNVLLSKGYPSYPVRLTGQ